MHIAIYDDNIADRKQLERLLGRESDKRIPTTGNLYCDSYGNMESLLHAPMQYQLFFIDSQASESAGMDIMHALRKAGVLAPIVMCSGKVDYTAFTNAGENVLHLCKPIQPAKLSEIIDVAMTINTNIESPITIQGEKETFYQKETNLLYITENRHMIHVHTVDGQILSTLGQLNELIHTLEENPHFFAISKTLLLNLCHIKRCSFGRILFDTGEPLRVPAFHSRKLQKLVRYAKTIHIDGAIYDYSS